MGRDKEAAPATIPVTVTATPLREQPIEERSKADQEILLRKAGGEIDLDREKKLRPSVLVNTWGTNDAVDWEDSLDTSPGGRGKGQLSGPIRIRDVIRMYLNERGPAETDT